MLKIGYAVEINNWLCAGEFEEILWQDCPERQIRLLQAEQPLLEPLTNRQLGVIAILSGFLDSVSGVGRYRITLENRTEEKFFVSRADVSWYIDCIECHVNYYTSSWGREFEPVVRPLLKGQPGITFGTFSGRSTKGCDTWIGLQTEQGAQCAALAWSGNWDAHAVWMPGKDQICASMGITSYGFSHALNGGARFEGAEVIMTGLLEDLEETAFSMRRFYRRHISSLPAEMVSLPFPYNGWWPYEDKLINEQVMTDNARIASALGCSHATMDAGWFGAEKDGEDWVDKRGDWEIVNTQKFPSGMTALGSHIRAMGMDFGIWCEIEAAGPKALLNQTHPEFIARRDGVSLGSVCMGRPKTRAWAMGIVQTLVEEYGASWIKFDFNLDQGMGCDCEEHGHGKHDGLYAHVRGYYLFLDEVQKKYPELILENCSSGGLRLDLGLLSKTKFGYLSDPDYSEHHQQCFWGATSYIHPSAAFHFTWSQTRSNENITREPIQADMPRSKFDYMIRSGMTGIPGISYRLVEFPDWCRDRLAEHIAFYKKYSAEYILNGDLYRLTKQPMREKRGERWCAYQYLAQSGKALLFVFRLEGAEAERTIQLRGLEEEARYQVTFQDAGITVCFSGKKLMSDGIVFTDLPEEGSEILLIEKLVD